MNLINKVNMFYYSENLKILITIFYAYNHIRFFLLYTLIWLSCYTGLQTQSIFLFHYH